MDRGLCRVACLTAVCLSTAAANLGCDRGPSKDEILRQIDVDYGRLSWLRSTTRQELADELRYVEEQQATPEQLSEVTLPPDENVAVGLASLFHASRLAAIAEETEPLLAPGYYYAEPTTYATITSMRERFAHQLEALRTALDRPACDFQTRLTSGFFADTSYTDVVTVCARLEAFEAAAALDRDAPEDAIAPWHNIMRLAAYLAREPHVAVRLEAAYIRGEASTVLEAIVRHPLTTRAQLSTLSNLVNGQLAAWTDDATAWIGDRAIGLHTYEVVAGGDLDMLLTADEIEQLAEEGLLERISGDDSRAALEADALFYLRTMRDVIAQCAHPYFERQAYFESLRRALHDRQKDDFPVVAGRILLIDIQRGHETQARDRALWEAWSIALALAAGEAQPGYELNPVAGRPYFIDHKDGKTTVWLSGLEPQGQMRSVVVPWPVASDSPADASP